jgi:hypothetical protein
LVTDPFDEHDRTQVDSHGPRMFHIPYLHNARTGTLIRGEGR